MILIINPSTKFSTPHWINTFPENERSFQTKQAFVLLISNVRFTKNKRSFYSTSVNTSPPELMDYV